MKKKITTRYLLVFTISVFMIIVLWIGLTYMTVFHRQQMDESRTPYLLAQRIGYYLDEETMEISDKGKAILRENELWTQIIDSKGKVLCEVDAPKEAPDSYDIFEMSHYVLNSDTMKGQTIYLRSFGSNKYGAILGFNSSKIRKYNIQFSGNVQEQIVKSIVILAMLFVVMGIIAGFIFSKTISSPIQEIIADINKLESDVAIENVNYNKNIFSSVYDSLLMLQLRLKSADREREKVERQKKKWISNISHDMKTPLTSIKAYIEMIGDKEIELSDDEREEYAEIILRNIEDIENLVEELKFSRLWEDGKVELDKEIININALIKECCDELPLADMRKSITCSFQQPLLYVNIDRQLIKRCLNNIICNAFKHNDGKVNVTIQSKQENDICIIEISDDGKGINKGESKKIFDRYYSGATENNNGSGLGLSIVKEIIAAHGGEVYVQNNLEQGSTFVLKI